MVWSYLPRIGLRAITALRSAGVTGPMRAVGGQISARSTIDGRAVAFQERYQRLALAELRDHLLGVELRVRPECVGRGLDRLLVARREGAQRMLHAVAELGQHLVRHVERILRDEIDPDALRADQPHHLLDLVEQRLRARR